MTVALSLEQVDKIYTPRRKPAVHAVRALDMHIDEGEIVALLGSSGCGKTSTLRMIAGFESVTNGTISLGGNRIDGLAPARRNVAMAFEGYSLYPPLTVRENIAFALKAARLPRDEIDRKVAEIADLLEIGPILKRYPSSISGGQQQRAGLARALVRSAGLHLLDEPMSQLEPQLRAVLRGRIKSFLIENRMTAMFVTHDQTEANALADRIAVMEGGELQQMASPSELKDRPANLFVATFIGEPPMNIFEGTVAAENGTPAVRVDGAGNAAGFAVTLAPSDTEAAATVLRPGRRVHLGIRPHSLHAGAGGDIPATVVSNQWLGDQTHLVLDLAGRTTVAVSYGRVPAAMGDAIACAVSARDIHLFDRESGAVLMHGEALA
ncbi:MAG: ABC transporter ATP-binding protein [Alphaproteobacteria bacterium]